MATTARVTDGTVWQHALMTDVDAVLDAHTPAAAVALEQASKGDRWWRFHRAQCDMFAQNHSWAESEVYLSDPRLRLRVAHARVLRGEHLAAQALLSEQPRDCAPEEVGFWSVPLRLEPWEARHWNPDLLVHYREGGSSGSSGQTIRFPPERLECPELLPATHFQGRTGKVESLGAYGLSGWIEWVTTVYGTAEQAAAHQIEVGGCGHPTSEVRAAIVDFASAYPALLGIFGGAAVYGGRVSESLGRLKVWRLLGELADSNVTADITSFVDRTRCVTWHHPCDEIWYLHLAMEDPSRGISWVLDGQDFD